MATARIAKLSMKMNNTKKKSFVPSDGARIEVIAKKNVVPVNPVISGTAD